MEILYFNANLILTINNDNSNRTAIPHFHTDNLHRTLRVMLASDDNNTVKVDQTRKIA